MDFKKFSDDNFDLKNWINAAFVSQKETNQNVDQFVATLITKLQVFIQEINNTIDDTSSQAVQNFPRVLRELEVLKQEAFVLKEQMRSVRDDLLKVEKNTVNESMKLLLDLDVMRTNMLKIQLALQEADNWTTLTSDLESILQTKDLNKITAHIESMQNSLTLLQDEDSMDYISRIALLEDFKNKFETIMSPDIIASFNAKSIEMSRNYVQIFERISRLDDLKKYYYQCERAKLLEKLSQMNSDVVGVVGNKSNSQTQNGDAIQSFLKSCLDYMIEVWHNEMSWCKQIFSDSHSIVINLLIKFFEEFNKLFVRLVSEHLQASDVYLDYMTQFKQETDLFTANIYSNTELAIKSSDQSQHLHDALLKLFQQIYSPFKSNLKDYTSSVLRYMNKQLETSIRMTHPDIVDNVQLLGDSVTSVFGLVDKEIQRCNLLSHNCCFIMLVDALKQFLKHYVDEFRRVVLNLKERKATSGSAAIAAGPNKHQNQLDESENWTLFRHFARIIQVVGDLIIKYEDLEESIERQVLESFIHDEHHETNNASNLLSVKYFKDFYLLEDYDKGRLNSMITFFESGGSEYSVLKELVNPINLLTESVHKYAFDIAFAPIKYLVRDLSKMSVWSSGKLGGGEDSSNSAAIPMFALVPQEYITKVGQYLLTLPQNFESLTMQDSTSLLIALRKGKLPYLDEKDLSDDLLACWLDSIANATYVALFDEVVKFERLSVNAKRQLIIDIEFICSVFDDVGLKDYQNLITLLELLKLDNEDEMEEKLKGKPARIISFIRRVF